MKSSLNSEEDEQQFREEEDEEWQKERTPMLGEFKSTENLSKAAIKKSGWQLFKKLMQLAKPEKYLLILGTICLFLGNGGLLAIPYIVGEIVGMYIAENN
jgi:hypothetical protein